MHMSQLLRRAFLVLGLAAFALPVGAEAQLRTIVSKSVSASSSGAELAIEFADDGTLEIAFDDGTILVDGDAVGSYEAGDELDTAWRTLLGDAMSLENGALARMLDGWAPPTDLDRDLENAAEAVDDALEDALADLDVEAENEDTSVSISINDEGSLVRLLLSAMGNLGVLEEALEGLDEDFRIHIDEDVVIPAGTVVEGTLVVIGGSLRVEGEIEGDAVIVDGTLDVRRDGSISGEARVADTRIVRNTGEIGGGIRDLLEDEREIESELRDELYDDIRAEIRSDLRNEIRNVTRFEDGGFSIMSPLRPIIRGVGGVFEKLVGVFILALLGAGFLAFAGENVDAVSETARRSPGRAAMVGVAGSFLLVPVWLLGAVALAITIIGIPVAIAWLPLFPLAAIMASLLGYVAVARNAGEWMADSSFPWTAWIRKSNPVFTLVGGLLAFAGLFIAGHVLSIAPFLNVFSTLLFIVGGVVTFVALQIGFGAVLLTRAGRRREHYSDYDADAAWEDAVRTNAEEGLGGDEGTTTGEGSDDA
jgi:hypothetical protein